MELGLHKEPHFNTFLHDRVVGDKKLIYQNYRLATATQEIKKMPENPQIVFVKNTNTHKYPQIHMIERRLGSYLLSIRWICSFIFFFKNCICGFANPIFWIFLRYFLCQSGNTVFSSHKHHRSISSPI